MDKESREGSECILDSKIIILCLGNIGAASRSIYREREKSSGKEYKRSNCKIICGGKVGVASSDNLGISSARRRVAAPTANQLSNTNDDTQ